MKEIRDDWQAFCIVRYDYGYVSDLPSQKMGSGTTLAAAIRDAGVRCETCEHWSDIGGIVGQCEMYGDSAPDFFCASHSLLTQPSEDKP